MYIYSIQDNKWRQGPDMTVARAFLGNAVNSDIKKPFSRLDQFRCKTLKFAKSTDPGFNVLGAGTFIHQGILYALGGYTDGYWAKRITMIDLATHKATTFIEDLPIDMRLREEGLQASPHSWQEWDTYILGSPTKH
eukprot:gene3862-4466_t